MSKLNAKQMDTIVNKGLDKIKSLSHLVLVVDEFTELKRFSSESNDVDFIAEITTIARVGRTLGFHIILVSQNIEGAIYQVSTNFCAVGFLPSFYQKSSDLRFFRFLVIARF